VHHLSVLLLYAFRQLSSSSYWYSYAASGILHCCDQTAGWMKTPLGTEVDLGAGIVLDGFPALRVRGTAPPSFKVLYIVATVAHLSYCWALVQTVAQKSKCNVTCLFLYNTFIIVLHNNLYLTQYRRVTDGWTDGRTDGIAVANTALAMRALHVL